MGWKLVAKIFKEGKIKQVLLDSGDDNTCMEGRISKKTLPEPMIFLGVFTYPALKMVVVHLRPEEE